MCTEEAERDSLICELYDEVKNSQKIANELWKEGYKDWSSFENVINRISRLKRAGKIKKTGHLQRTEFIPWVIQFTEDHTLKIYLNSHCVYCGDTFQVATYSIDTEPDEAEVICRLCKAMERKALEED